MKRLPGPMFISVFLLLTVALTLVGCGQKGPSAEEIVSATFEAAGEIETVQFDMSMVMSISGTSAGEDIEAAISYQAQGLVDSVAKEMAMEITMRMEMPEEAGAPQSMGMDMYLVDDYLYMKVSGPGIPEQWLKSELPPESWELMEPFGRYTELLGEAAEAELLGTERVDGTDCYLLQVSLDIGKAWETMMGQPGISELLGLGDMPFDLGEVVRSFSVRYWVARDTFLLARAQVQMTMEISSEDLDIPEAAEEPFEMTMGFDMDAAYHSYDEPVSIKLPAEAEEAMEVPGLMQ